MLRTRLTGVPAGASLCQGSVWTVRSSQCTGGDCEALTLPLDSRSCPCGCAALTFWQRTCPLTRESWDKDRPHSSVWEGSRWVDGLQDDCREPQQEDPSFMAAGWCFWDCRQGVMLEERPVLFIVPSGGLLLA